MARQECDQASGMSSCELGAHDDKLLLALAQATKESAPKGWTNDARIDLEKALIPFVRVAGQMRGYNWVGARGELILNQLQEIFSKIPDFEKEKKGIRVNNPSYPDLFGGVKDSLRQKHGVLAIGVPEETFMETVTILRTGHTARELAHHVEEASVKIRNPLVGASVDAIRRKRKRLNNSPI